MCDTLVALGIATTDGSVLFAKNSDREPNEAEALQIIPAADHPAGSLVQCTYISIPQVEHTYRVLLARPFWMWGAEMGANEHDVVIGNEALFTKVPYEKGPGLTGMDLLRLALERSTSAIEALKVIVDLLEKYGQGGSGGYTHPFYYHNAFLIADAGSAWVLETAGKQWAAEQVKDVRSISNAISIGSSWDLASNDLVAFARDQGWCKGRDDFNYARCYSDPLITHFAAARSRAQCSLHALQAARGRIDLAKVMSILRSHNGDSQAGWSPSKGLVGADVCVHAGFGPVRINQTAGSMVSHLRSGGSLHWVTGTAAPCTSIFKPVWMDNDLPSAGLVPGEKYDTQALWYRHEKVHRTALANYASAMHLIKGERDFLEGEWAERASELNNCGSEERLAFSTECFRQGDELDQHWLEKLQQQGIVGKVGGLYGKAWNKWNYEIGLSLGEKK